MRLELSRKIKEEMIKQLEAGFLEVSTYLEWVANIFPVPKKDVYVRMCVNHQDLNRASLKDDFPLPHIDVLDDNIAKNHRYSSWMVTWDAIRLPWQKKTKRIPHSSLIGTLIAIG
ncbi:hypothetical protein L6164_023952 [Bauhinia variegata]|uniref:Uncharacterized protein n=1 Tax=Bauhinia variegata TaxID=167791 RepID=A0ACB9LX08_BAUVA|nr:hypothetical protein L6164_023952 [Bauhinia variegata]